MTVRYGPDERHTVQVLWRHPVMFRSELHDYLGLDRLVEDGAGCASCGKALRYPLVEWTVGRNDLLLHPSCAEEIGRALLDDVGVIAASRREKGRPEDNEGGPEVRAWMAAVACLPTSEELADRLRGRDPELGESEALEEGHAAREVALRTLEELLTDAEAEEGR